MSIDPKELEKLNRDELIARAQQLGAVRPELLTRPELRDEIIRLSECDESERRRARGWFGVARDLVASVVGQGLNLPDTVDLIRSANVLNQKGSPPVATVTLAEIYAAQGHVRKALDLLDEVLANEPDHEAARLARSRWAQETPNGLSRAASSGMDERSTVEVPELADVQDTAIRQGPQSSTASETVGTSVSGQTACATAADSPLFDAVHGPEASLDVAVPSTSSDGFEATKDVAVPSTSSDGAFAEATTSHDEAVSRELVAPSAEAAQGDVPAQSEFSLRGVVDVVQIEPSAASAQHASARSGIAARMPENMVEPAAPNAPSTVGQAEQSSPSREPVRPLAQLTQARSADKPRVLLVRTAANELQCCWSVSEERIQRLQAKEPKGRLVLRVLEVTAAWEGPQRREFDIELPEATGQQRVTLDDSPAEVRLVIGWLADQRFTVIEIGTEFAWDALNGAQLRWAAPAAPREHLEQVGAAAVTRMMRSVQAA